MNKLKKMFKHLGYALLCAPVVFYFSSCEDYMQGTNRGNSEEPEWLNDNIYDFLKKDGRFTSFVRIIDAIEDENGSKYAEVLQKTGSKTLFVATDDAFEAFYAANPYGINRFEDFSPAMCRAILFSGMLDNTYLIEMLSNIAGTPPIPGQAMRRTTSWGAIDSIPFEKSADLPRSHYWDRFRERGGLYLMKDRSDYTMIHFLAPQMKTQGITKSDFDLITGLGWNENDAYIFDIKIIEKDITCQNGYVNVLEKLLLPRENMAEFIRKEPSVSLFNRFLERFSAPYYDNGRTVAYREIHPEFRDSIFTKRFFNTQEVAAAKLLLDPADVAVKAALTYDPGRNNYRSYDNATAEQTDMAALFAPSDEALDNYFERGAGLFLKDRYGSWDNVPDEVLNLLINNHMRISFLASVPSRFGAMEDKMGTPLGVLPGDIKRSFIASNGIVYLTDKVYPPTEYASVMAPVFTNDNAAIFTWAIREYHFDLYLLSMEKGIFYSLLVPLDDVFNNYINPASVGRGMPQRWRFWFDNKTNRVNATVYNAASGDSVMLISNPTMIRNQLMDILDNHIIVGNIEDGKRFYQTKGGATIQVGGQGVGMSIRGGANVERSEDIKAINRYEMTNGLTYLLNGVAQTPLKSVYEIMNNTDEYKAFFNLCLGAKEFKIGLQKYAGTIFSSDPSFAGITPNVSFFNTYNYTVYVPTNQAIEQAIADGEIKTWEMIDEMDKDPDSDPLEVVLEAQKLYDFLRYHFQDNSVYISGAPVVERSFDTATRRPGTNKFYQLTVSGNGNNLNIETAAGGKANVQTDNPALYNVMARDYKFSDGDIRNVNDIATSSYAVIHRINTILKYQ
ncbi:MAG: hypothetical protein LBI65_00940 [Candidatus Symbiothrix sp.]|nr:hypothetical protein [Candidatus Symbiothrix sp.]